MGEGRKAGWADPISQNPFGRCWGSNKYLGKRERNCKSRKRISNENIDDTKIVKSLEYSEVLLHGVTEAVKQEIKNKAVDFLLFC